MNEQKKEPKPWKKFWLKLRGLKILIEAATSLINLIKILL
jgi:hypothetical protein